MDGKWQGGGGREPCQCLKGGLWGIRSYLPFPQSWEKLHHGPGSHKLVDRSINQAFCLLRGTKVLSNHVGM